MVKDKQPKRTCLCECGSTNSATKAKHKRAAEQPLLCQTLNLAQAMARIRPQDQTPQPTPGPSHAAGTSHLHLSLPSSTELATLMEVDRGET